MRLCTPPIRLLHPASLSPYPDKGGVEEQEANVQGGAAQRPKRQAQRVQPPPLLGQRLADLGTRTHGSNEVGGEGVGLVRWCCPVARREKNWGGAVGRNKRGLQPQLMGLAWSWVVGEVQGVGE